ncbi:MAG: glycosyltransferase family A protein [Synergistaceae bacterium]
MNIEICIHCFSYQRRLCWMLSSILQQKGDIPSIAVSISYVANNGDPTTEKVIEYFTAKGMKIIPVELEEKDKGNRAIPRNIRAKETEADWILFADCDHVYDPFFFEDIKRQLESDEFKNETRVIGADRHSLDIKFCMEYFDKDKTEYPSEIENVADIVSKWPVQWIHGRNIAAGNFQLANVKTIKDKGGVYSGRKRDFWRRTKSDRQFRVHMGGRVSMIVKNQYHLNHDRGSHDIQR